MTCVQRWPSSELQTSFSECSVEKSCPTRSAPPKSHSLPRKATTVCALRGDHSALPTFSQVTPSGDDQTSFSGTRSAYRRPPNIQSRLLKKAYSCEIRSPQSAFW